MQASLSYSIDRASKVIGPGWLQSYVDWASTTTDAPRAYHFMVGLATLGVVMGNQYAIQGWGGKLIYPNLYLLLLSPSGFYRKSTAAEIGLHLLNNLDGDSPILPGKFTPESLFETLSKQPSGLIFWSEFSGALRRLHREYMQGCMEDLTDIYDSPEKLEMKTRTKGLETIKHPAVSIIGCSTNTWLAQAVKQGDLQGGFLSRFLFVTAMHGDKGRRIDEPVPPLNPVMREELLNSLRVLSIGRKRIADFSNVSDGYNTWLEYSEGQFENGNKPQNLIGFYSRQGLHVKKLALILQASMTPGNPIKITSEALSAALFLFEGLVSSTEAAIANIDWDPDAQALSLIKTTLATAGGAMTRQELLRSLKMNINKAELYIKTLVNSDELKLITERTHGRPRYLYCLPNFKPATEIEIDDAQAEFLSEPRY